MEQENENKKIDNRDIPIHPWYGTTTLPHHKWRCGRDGSVDIFALDLGHCNGPKCVRCGESFCHHCHPECYDESCTAEGFICPTCKDIVTCGDNFCGNCGQRLAWSSD